MEKLKANKRLLALDILRGITIAGMILVNNPGTWAHVYAPLCHAQWNGLTPTDLVFPFFMFIMGISTYISLRKYHFQFSRAVGLKILKRTLLIFLIGLAIGWFAHFCYYWADAPTDLSFGQNLWASVSTLGHLRILGVMQRLALCYGATALIALTLKHRHIPYLIATLLTGYFLLLLWGNGFAYNDTNILSLADRAILGPEHMYNDHGIDPEGLLSTLPAIAHVLLGFYVGRLMLGGTKTDDRASLLNSQLLTLLLTGVILTFAGFLLSYGCPINKKVWSPTFVLVTCGLASSFLGLLIWIIDVKGHKRWSVFFEAFGVNPLFLYVLSDVLAILFGSITLPWHGDSISIDTLLYSLLQPLFGDTGGSLAYALLFVAINWGIGYQLYKRKWYLSL